MNRNKYKSVRMRRTIWDFHFSRLLIIGNPPQNDVIIFLKNSYFTSLHVSPKKVILIILKIQRENTDTKNENIASNQFT